MPDSLILRAAVQADAAGIAAVNTQSWRETYPGIMPEKRMANLNEESCKRNWENSLSNPGNTYVAELQGKIIGFVSGGANRHNDYCETGLGDECESELAAIYLLQEYHGRGIGKALFELFAQAMRDANYSTMVVWVAEKNKSTRFYERMGGELVDRKILLVCEEPVPVIAYRYVL
jgi:GNAT superfamily N-acetyltransferase